MNGVFEVSLVDGTRIEYGGSEAKECYAAIAATAAWLRYICWAAIGAGSGINIDVGVIDRRMLRAQLFHDGFGNRGGNDQPQRRTLGRIINFHVNDTVRSVVILDIHDVFL